MSVRRLAKEQPASFAFAPEALEKARWWISKFPEGRAQSAVIPVLWLVQKQEGWVPEPALRVVADLLGMPVIRVLENVTFYTMFQLSPVGTTAHVQLCGTTPCMLRGANDLKKSRWRPRSVTAITPAPTAGSLGKRSNAWAPAPMRRWRRSMTTTTRT